MAKTIGQTTSATTLGNSDLFLIEQSGQTKSVAASVVRGGLVNADIDAAAAIAFSKLAALDSANILVGNGSNVATKVAVTGDVTISNAGVTAIAAGAVVTADVADTAITAPKLSGAQTGSAPIYGCRAWVNFDGTRNEADTGASTNAANVKIRASGNVASVLKNGTGDYTITFTTAMPDANFSEVIGGRRTTIGTVSQSFKTEAGTKTSSTLQVLTGTTSSNSAGDHEEVCVAIFR
jgi:hypothetical protein